ncbi:hypothetical protein PIROE2DRAFT_3489 [Piromyces sp. E2]|nr:hypothetical protein PIROE2DRAFT_3489 [Piromyces sp. E2]|eukprot:OUM68791.1 hypothetical protein PIROE2DRAFT_3489 [Piromyces sp. E2]
MKFHHQLISFLLVSPVFSRYYNSLLTDFVLESTPNNSLMKRVNPTPEYEEAYLKCGNALKEKKYDECLKNVNNEYIDNIDTNCNFFNSEKCQDFYSNGLAIVSECQGDILKEDRNVDQMLLDTFMAEYKYICSKDEFGEKCPYYVIAYSTYNNVTEPMIPQIYEKQLYSVIENTCKSPICTKEFLAFNEQIQKHEEIYTKYKEENRKIKEKKGKIIVNKEKRNFSIEDFTHVDKETIRELTIQYLKSEECRNLALKEEGKIKMEKEVKENNASLSKNNRILLVILLLPILIFTFL